ncbi:hypothetical protein XocBAI15_01660 [Xanthomonas oryzae pv. oryzicola]|nr:hypothetical protein XocBAI15_01660 [Xanthomonas oryzae pv. oryzicola]OWB31674.1 hypothetical protein XocBAI20_06035 [Xanthomonas oryzae pv. oryzicola]
MNSPLGSQPRSASLADWPCTNALLARHACGGACHTAVHAIASHNSCCTVTHHHSRACLIFVNSTDT